MRLLVGGKGIGGKGVALIHLAVSAAGCGVGGDDPTAGAIEFAQRDSAGVTIAESSAAVLDVTVDWVIEPEPDLVIGEGDGATPEGFDRISGVVSTGSGELVVIDGGSGELRWFDEDGDFLRAQGGRGRGPGEFEAPRLVPGADRETLVVFDTGLRRFTILRLDGSEFRSWPAEGLPPELLAGAVVGRRGSRVLFHTVSGLCMDEGPCTLPSFLRWIDVERGAVDTIARPVQEFVVTSDVGRYPTQVRVPFTNRRAVGTGAEGPLVAFGTDHTIIEYGVDGTPGRILRVDAAPRRVSAQDLEDVAEARAAGAPEYASAIRDLYAEIPTPGEWPSFESVLLDRQGWVWAELYRPHSESSSRWLVFDRDGRAHGTIRMPSGLEVVEIGQDYVLGTWQDELGIEYVRRHRLRRTY